MLSDVFFLQWTASLRSALQSCHIVLLCWHLSVPLQGSAAMRLGVVCKLLLIRFFLCFLAAQSTCPVGYLHSPPAEYLVDRMICVLKKKSDMLSIKIGWLFEFWICRKSWTISLWKRSMFQYVVFLHTGIILESYALWVCGFLNCVVPPVHLHRSLTHI